MIQEIRENTSKQEKLDKEFYESLKKAPEKVVKYWNRGDEFSDKEIEDTKQMILNMTPFGYIFTGRDLERLLNLNDRLILIAMAELRQHGEIMYACDYGTNITRNRFVKKEKVVGNGV